MTFLLVPAGPPDENLNCVLPALFPSTGHNCAKWRVQLVVYGSRTLSPDVWRSYHSAEKQVGRIGLHLSESKSISYHKFYSELKCH